MTKMGRALFASTLLGLTMPQLSVRAAVLLCALLLPHTSGASPLCQPSKDCICPGGPGSNFCILQLRINNPQYVHFKLLGDWEFVNLRQGTNQSEVKPGVTTYVKRSPDGPTSFGVQFCKRTFTGGTNCSTWATMTLQEPTAGQLHACETYADKAVGIYKQSKKVPCGFHDGRWTDDRKSHYNWCANLSDADRHFMQSETDARQQGLNDCKAKVAAKNAPPPPPKNYGGTWAVDLSGVPYTFVLTQQGPAINGQMVSSDPQRNGTLQGSMEPDGRATFSYVQPQLNTGGHGRFWLEGTVDKLGGRFFFNGEQAVRLLEGSRK